MKPRLVRFALLATTLLVGSGATAQQGRRTIFLPRMGGFERNVAGALKAQQVPVDVVPEESKPDLKGEFTPAGSLGGTAAVLHEKTGRYPEDILDVKQVDSRRTLLRYRFFLMDDPDSRARVAVEFAQELRKKLTPKKKRQ